MDKNDKLMRLLAKVNGARRRQFCLEFMIDHNVSQAAIRAGYAYSSASVQGTKILKNPQVQAYIKAAEEQDVEELKIERHIVLRELYRALTYRIADFFDDEGEVLMPHQLPEHVQTVVEGFEVDEKISYDEEGNERRRRKIKCKLTPRAAARDQAMKHKGLFAPDRLDLSLGVAREILDRLGQAPPPDQIEHELKLLEEQTGGTILDVDSTTTNMGGNGNGKQKD